MDLPRGTQVAAFHLVESGSLEIHRPGESALLLEAGEMAVSFGGVSSSISAPRWMSHASVPEGAAPRPEPNFVRLSIGLECPQDLLLDLEAALYGSVTGHTKSPGLKVRID